EVAVAHPARPHADMADAGPRQAVAPVGVDGEVDGAQPLELGALGQVGDPLDLGALLVVPADHQGDARVGAEVRVLARGVDGVEDDLARVAGGPADDGGLRRAVGAAGGEDGEAGFAQESDELGGGHRDLSYTAMKKIIEAFAGDPEVTYGG